eukprot:353638-Chlamydomonas_euryale.AAC.1
MRFESRRMHQHGWSAWMQHMRFESRRMHQHGWSAWMLQAADADGSDDTSVALAAKSTQDPNVALTEPATQRSAGRMCVGVCMLSPRASMDGWAVHVGGWWMGKPCGDVSGC